MRLFLLGLIGMGCAAAQQAIPAASEPHHRTIYEDPRVRILTVEIEPHASTASHRHASDYVTASLGVSSSSLRFSRSAAAHSDRNDSGVPLREIVIELLQRQTGPRNVCAETLAGEYLHCHEPGAEWLGANLQVQFETDQGRFDILQVAPNASVSVPPADVPALLIALDAAEVETSTRTNAASTPAAIRRKVQNGDVLRWTADQVSEIRNQGKAPARFLVVEFGGAGE